MWNKYFVLLVSSLVLLFIVPFARASTPFFPGTPPSLNLVIKDIELKTAGKVTGSYIDSPVGGAAIVENKNFEISVRRNLSNSFYEDTGDKLEQYPAISLRSETDLVTICMPGVAPDFRPICQNDINEFKGVNDLKIIPSVQVKNDYFTYYLQEREIVQFSDWRVVGKATGSRQNKKENLVEFIITGNFEYTPASDDWLQSTKEFGERIEQENKILSVGKGIILVALIILVVLIFKKKEHSFKRKLLSLFLTLLIAFIFYTFLNLLFGFVY